MKTFKKVVAWFKACFGVQYSDEVIVSEFRTKEEFAETMRLMSLHSRRARNQSLPNSWVLPGR